MDSAGVSPVDVADLCRVVPLQVLAHRSVHSESGILSSVCDREVGEVGVFVNGTFHYLGLIFFK